MDFRLKVLLADHDTGERNLLVGILRAFGVEVEVPIEAKRAADSINKQKFDGLFLAEGMPGAAGLELLQTARASAANRDTPIIFIPNKTSSISTAQAFKAGATFLLNRPLDREKVTHLLNATRGTMLAERRNHHRVLLNESVDFSAGTKEGEGNSVNVSRTGILFEAAGVLKAGESVKVEFRLPSEAEPVRAEGVVVHVDSEGRAGVRFSKLAGTDQEKLNKFIKV